MTNLYPSIEGLSVEQVQTLVGCRTPAQYNNMIESYLAGRCVFCDLDPTKNVVIRETALWHMWHNPFPMVHTQYHLVLATKQHIVGTESMTLPHYTELGELFEWARNEFQLEGGALLMRFGAPEKNAGSVLHQHANIIAPNGQGDVKPSLAKAPDHLARNIACMYVFERLRLGMSMELLTPEEIELITARVK